MCHGILALEPDLVLAAEINPPELVKQLEDLGLTVYYLKNPLTLEGMYGNLGIVGQLTGHDVAGLVDSLKELMRYTEHHFATEERLMDEVGAGAERHRSEHRRLIDGLMRYTVSLDVRTVGQSSRFLQDWLFKHIDEVDRPFAAFLRSRGVK